MRGLVGQPRERCVTRHAPLLGLERCTVPQQPATEEADLESTASCRRLPLSRTLVGMADTARLRQWLATLTTEQLQMVLEAIPTFTAGTQIRDLDELTMRLAHPSVIGQVLLTAPSPVLELVETASAVGRGATLDRLAELLENDGRSRADQVTQIRHWLDVAAASALAWVEKENVLLNPGVDEIIIGPLAIARPARAILTDARAEDLRHTLRAWGVKPPQRKAEMLAEVEQGLCDPQLIRRLASQAPEDVLGTLNEHVSERLASARVIGDDERPESIEPGMAFDRARYAAERRMWTWIHQAGLAPAGRGFGFLGDSELPVEVYLALAPPQFRVPFSPQPPPLATTALPTAQIDRSSAAALTEFMGTAMAILEAIAREGLATIKAGGVGSRELNRFAKKTNTDVATVRLALTLAAANGMLASGDGIAVTDKFSTWRRQRPAHRAADLITSWFALDVAPSLERDDGGSYIPALGRMPETSGMPYGFVMCRLLAETEGRAAVSGTEMLARVKWNHPMAQIAPGSPERSWQEAHQIGVLADGALTPFAHALTHQEFDRGVALLGELLPETNSTVMFGSDLTIVVPGSPEASVVDVLDVVAHREGHGVVGTWRVSETSVREALDAGYTAKDLLASLRGLSDHDLPQALEYLIGDVDRKHGHLSVRPAQAIITTEDEALLAEVVATRKLRTLGLHEVAPGVAVAARSPEQVLSALRAAGYLPVEVDDGGARVVQLRRLAGSARDSTTGDDAGGETATGGAAANEGRSAPSTSDPDDAADLESVDDTMIEEFLNTMQSGEHEAKSAVRPVAAAETSAELAERLLTQKAVPHDPLTADLEAELFTHARRLDRAQIHDLADALVYAGAVQITYRSGSGGQTTRVVSDLELIAPYLSGFCHLRQAERIFRLDQILSLTQA